MAKYMWSGMAIGIWLNVPFIIWNTFQTMELAERATGPMVDELLTRVDGQQTRMWLVVGVGAVLMVLSYLAKVCEQLQELNELWQEEEVEDE